MTRIDRDLVGGARSSSTGSCARNGDERDDPHIRVRCARFRGVAGTATRAAEMTFYQLPSGAYPHDVAPAPDGTVWISGQRQGFAGRFDPKTGTWKRSRSDRARRPMA